MDGKDILLVEDSPSDAEMTLRALKKVGLAERITWLKNGQEGIDYVFREGAWATRPPGEPRLILLDLKMPKVDGLEVLARIKRDERSSTIPVVMLTSSAEEQDIVKSYKLGVNSYIVKPVEAETFIQEVCKAGSYWATMNKAPCGG